MNTTLQNIFKMVGIAIIGFLVYLVLRVALINDFGVHIADETSLIAGTIITVGLGYIVFCRDVRDDTI